MNVWSVAFISISVSVEFMTHVNQVENSCIFQSENISSNNENVISVISRYLYMFTCFDICVWFAPSKNL